MMVYRASFYHPVHGHSWAWGGKQEEAIAKAMDALDNPEDTGPIGIEKCYVPNNPTALLEWLNNYATRDNVEG